MKYGLLTFLAVAVGLTGCGSSNTPSAENPGGEHHEHAEHHEHGEHGEHGEEHHDLKGPIAEFHDILAPIWHGPDGSEKRTKACEQAQAMHDKAAAIEAAPPPEGAKADDYKAAAKALTTEVDGMAAECKKETMNGVDLHLKMVHEAFHKVAEQAGAHGEHHER